MAFRSLSLLSLAFSLCSQGFKIPEHSGLRRRDILNFTQNILYTSSDADGIFLEVSVNGDLVPVEIDLASSDLFVTGQLFGSSSFNSTGVQASPVYPFLDPPVTDVTAPIVKATVTVAGRSVQQPFISYPSDHPGLSAAFPQATAHGVLGFGPSKSSVVVQDLKSGLSPMDNIYATNSSQPYLTILYAGPDGSESSGPEFAGFFSIGSPVPLAEIFAGSGVNISELPQVDGITGQPAISLSSDYTFPVSALTVNGQIVSLSSSVSGASSGTAVASLSTRGNYTVVPSSIATAMFGSVAGSSYDSSTGLYSLPCTTEVNVTINIGGVTIPLDPATVVVQIPGTTQCVGSFQANIHQTASTTFDISFGILFMPNVYVLLGYESVSGQTLSKPIMRLLALTDVGDAHSDFVLSRGGQQSSSGAAHTRFTTLTVTHTPTTTVIIGGPTSSPQATSAGASSGAERLSGNLDVQPESKTSDNNTTNGPTGSVADQLKHCLPAIIVGAIVVALMLIGGVIYCLVRRSRSSGVKASAYQNIHNAESTDHSRSLYGHDEESMKYADPYTDKI